MKTIHKVFVGLLVLSSIQANAALINIPTPLNTAVKPPMTVTINGVLQLNGTNSLILNNTKLVQLGKALFWDTAVGSDGMACASCHFKAGADTRTINQVNPGFNHNSQTYDAFRSGHSTMHSQLSVNDFPMWNFTTLDPATVPPALPRFIATVIDDTVSSAGTLNGAFVSNLSPAGTKRDTCTARPSLGLTDPSFDQLSGLDIRRVEPRNTPTMVNATFNVRNFWDGRANRVFNGNNPFGLRDLGAKVWMNSGVPTQVKLEVNNASLASQAVGPVLSDLEMSCNGRTFDQVGNKIVNRVPLVGQTIAATDSVLSPITSAGAITPVNTYRNLIHTAFQPTLWTGSNTNSIPLDEANFALFFGMAVQAYEDTLRSGQSKFDLIPRVLQPFTPPGAVTPIALIRQPLRVGGIFRGLTRSESRGLDLFMGLISPLNPIGGVDPLTGVPFPQKNGRCILCHNGPEFTSAAFTALAAAPAGVRLLPGAVVPREFLAEPMPFLAALPNAPIPVDVGVPVFNPLLSFGTYDLGFYDIGVTPCQASGVANDFTCVGAGSFDRGLGGTDPFGNPLAFAKQWQNEFLTIPVGEKCAFEPLIGGLPVNGISCKPPITPDVFNINVNFVDVAGNPLIMTPILSPARTDGSFKTPSLRNVELTAPYFHNGSAKTIQEALQVYNNGGLFAANPNHHPEIIPLGFNGVDITDVTNFLLTLTDPRVKFERAPFDHPALSVPNGHKVPFVSTASVGNADDVLLNVPSVGNAGLGTAPLGFVQRLAP